MNNTHNCETAAIVHHVTESAHSKTGNIMFGNSALPSRCHFYYAALSLDVLPTVFKS